MLAALIGTGAVLLVAIIGAAWHQGVRQGMVVAELAAIRYRLGNVERAVGLVREPESEGARRRR